MTAIKGFAIQEGSYTIGSHYYHTAIRELDGRLVLLKVAESNALDSPQVSSLKREYQILGSLHHPCLIKALDYVEFYGGAALVMEHFESIRLSQLLWTRRLNLQESLGIGMHLCDGIAYLQSQNIIHKDINPGTILVNPDTLEIRIFQFSISSQLPEEEIVPENSTELEGTLPYLSPEQTGRMNRSIDYRSDLYSLGVTMYEMLTGKLPFGSLDPLELVHAHLALKPVPPANVAPLLPQVLSNIVMKLLEKAPENRYRSASGLKSDLLKCLQAIENGQPVPHFEIATNDFSEKLSISKKLYGREKEMAAMMEAFGNAGMGNTQVLFISGVPGIGKSVLVSEITKPVFENKGLFIRGKFDQFNRNVPYSAISEAFGELVDYMLAQNKDELDKWRGRILDEVGELGQLLVDVIPSLGYVIGEQPSVPPLPAAEAFNRFTLVFQNLVRAIASGPGSLVLFLDDLQWADLPSLQLLEMLINDKEQKHLLIIGAYRDSELTRDHPLHHILQTSATTFHVHQIHLGPLQLNDLSQLLSDTFLCGRNEVEDLSALIDQKTKRNPFFVTEFIKTLYKKGLVYFDQTKRCWKWSVAQIKLSNITDNVVELVAGTLQLLESETQRVCALAACIGNQFDLQTLAVVSEKDSERTAKDLWPAVQEGIILPTSESYRMIGNNTSSSRKISFKFLHDRVQQAAYSIIPNADKGAIHLKTGRLLYEAEKNKYGEPRLFDIANHLNRGKALITDEAEGRLLARLNFRAGRKAKQSSAFEPAYLYFSTAIDLLQKDAWNDEYLFTLNLHNEAAEMAYLSVKPQEVETLTGRIFEHARKALDTVNAYLVKIAFYGSQGDNAQAVRTSYDILEKLGVVLPAKPNQLHVLQGLIGTKLRLRGKTMDDLFNRPQMADEKARAAMSVLSMVTGPAYIANTNLFVLVVFKTIELSIKYGNNRFSSFGYAVFGMVLAGMMDLEGVKNYSNLSRRLLDHYPQDEQYSKVQYCLLTLHFLHHPMQQSQGLMRQNIQKAFDSGDFLYGSYSVFYELALKFFGGYPLADLVTAHEPFCEKLASLNQQIGLGWTNTLMQTIGNLVSTEDTNILLKGSYFNEEEMLPQMQATNNVSGIALLFVMKGLLSYVLDDFEGAVAHFKKAGKNLGSLVGTPLVPAYHFYRSLAHAALYNSRSVSQKAATYRMLRQSIGLFKKWAKHSPANNQAKLHILQAVAAQLFGSRKKAIEWLELAAQLADQNRLIQESALAHELLGKIYMASGEHGAFQEHMLEARFRYHLWRAQAKVRLMEKLYRLRHERMDAPQAAEGNLSAASLDLQTVIKASQTLSSEVQLEGLFKRMVHIVLESAGATAGTILLREGNTWSQRATYSIANGQQNLDLTIVPFSEENAAKLALPVTVANYLIHTRKPLALSHPQQNPAYAKDSYLQRHDPKSILCLPFSSKGDDLGILYLENNLIADAFTEDRVRLLSMLTAQLAISVENAFLYETLEQKVQARTFDLSEKNRELEIEKKKSDRLLLNILPATVADELKERGQAKARLHPKATVLFADVKDFSAMAAHLNPEELVTMLHKYFSRFDEISTAYGLEKIKTIGDAYMAVAGLPDGNKATAVDVVKAANDMLEATRQLQAQYPHMKQPVFATRIGIHTGPVVSGIVGQSKFQFDIWGDTVNIAARLEQTSDPGKINISRSTYEEVKGHFMFEPRGLLPVKNRSDVEMFFVR